MSQLLNYNICNAFIRLPICTRDFNTSAGRVEIQQTIPVVPYKAKRERQSSYT